MAGAVQERCGCGVLCHPAAVVAEDEQCRNSSVVSA